eukprot:365186-Chlamydomonas_euryale.AAC.7
MAKTSRCSATSAVTRPPQPPSRSALWVPSRAAWCTDDMGCRCGSRFPLAAWLSGFVAAACCLALLLATDRCRLPLAAAEACASCRCLAPLLAAAAQTRSGAKTRAQCAARQPRFKCVDAGVYTQRGRRGRQAAACLRAELEGKWPPPAPRRSSLVSCTRFEVLSETLRAAGARRTGSLCARAAQRMSKEARW